MKTPIRLATFQFTSGTRLVTIVVVVTLLLFGGMSPVVVAAPDGSSSAGMTRAQNVDWMSPDTAAALDLPMDVLVPSWIPAPFSGMAPSVTASGGYYQLYWMISGGPPTFLYIEGTVGGGLPAGSPANLNEPLSINASVQGWNAIHDIGIPEGSDTPIYDQVWWIANGVLYTVSSNNMTGTDTLSLANSLIVLQPPVVAEPTVPPVPTEPPYVPPTEPPYVAPTEPPYVEPTLPVEVPQEPTEPPYVEPTAPPVTEAPDVAPPAESGVGGEDSSGQVPVDDPAPTEPVMTDTSGETNTETAEQPAEEAPVQDEGTSDSTNGTGEAWSPERSDSSVPSDGTNGPEPPVIGSDGTGGAYDIALPNIFVRP